MVTLLRGSTPFSPGLVVSFASCHGRGARPVLGRAGWCGFRLEFILRGDMIAEPPSPPACEPQVRCLVGVYGISGVGKSRLLRELAQRRPEWQVVEGSQAIIATMDRHGGGGLDAFKRSAEKDQIRCEAIRKISAESTGMTVVAGHFSFAKKGMSGFEPCFTSADAQSFHSIVYLDHRSAEEIMKQRLDDETRQRPATRPLDLESWIRYEVEGLSAVCAKAGIAFVRSSELLPDTEEKDGSMTLVKAVEEKLAEALSPLFEVAEMESKAAAIRDALALPKAECYLLIDGDRTMCSVDTSAAFFDNLPQKEGQLRFDMITSIFKRHPGYCFRAFAEVAMSYGRLPYSAYAAHAKATAQTIQLYPEFVDLLRALPSSVHPVLITAGIRELWLSLLERHELLRRADGSVLMSVIAGNRWGVDGHRYIVTDDSKGLVASTVKECRGGAWVFAFGDSLLDLSMLEAADRAYVALDSKGNRSLMPYLQKVSGSQGESHKVFQLLLGEGGGHPPHVGIQVGSLTTLGTELAANTFNRLMDFSRDHAAQLLATVTRRADVAGPALQAAHEDVGSFLAQRLIANEFEVTAISIPHVQNRVDLGFDIKDGKRVTILAMMRAGDPMARGVHRRFPQATFVHYDDKLPRTRATVEALGARLGRDLIVVDSVINSGKSIRALLTDLQSLGDDTVRRVFVLTGVMQSAPSSELPVEFPTVRFYTLRVSSNKYIGKGGTDTGNRLFGTM